MRWSLILSLTFLKNLYSYFRDVDSQANRAINRLKEASLISSFDFHICQDVDGKSFKVVHASACDCRV